MQRMTVLLAYGNDRKKGEPQVSSSRFCPAILFVVFVIKTKKTLQNSGCDNRIRSFADPGVIPD
ncbi:MAG: hypothetical protein Q4B13_09030 [Lautropia sp.]|nr:hypothetical protein [Lautropia sp.]